MYRLVIKLANKTQVLKPQLFENASEVQRSSLHYWGLWRWIKRR